MALSINESNYVSKAETVIQELMKNKNKKGKVEMVTTSKIRNVMAMSADIYNEVLVQDEKLTSDIASRIDYLRVRFIYEAGREKLVKLFVEKADILDILQNVKVSRKDYILYYRYMEALVAFHKYYGGQD